jgi:hypothetical protein
MTQSLVPQSATSLMRYDLAEDLRYKGFLE